KTRHTFRSPTEFCKTRPCTGSTSKRKRMLRTSRCATSHANQIEDGCVDRTSELDERISRGGLRRATHRLVRNSFSSQQPRVQRTAREQHLVQRGLCGRLGDAATAVCVEVVLCDSTKKLFDECGTRAVCTTSQIVHQL